jgi:hypothetical protein
LLGLIGDRGSGGPGRNALVQLLENGQNAQRQRQAWQLLAEASVPLTAGESRRQGGRIDLAMAGIVGIAAGVIATVAQLVLWWLANVPVAETLLRDTRLTAALLDRLTHKAHILEFVGDSHRIRQRVQQERRRGVVTEAGVPA